MTDSLSINDVVSQTGLTSRALRFYEARGLLDPLRTGSKRRYYGPDQLERIHQIVTLKKAGLSLAQIGRLLDRKPLDLAQLLSGQLANLTAQAEEIELARTNLQTALSRIESGDSLDAANLCSLIKDGDRAIAEENWKKVIDRYYTPEEQAEWQAHVGDKMDMFQQQEYQEQWKALSARIEAALPLDPASDMALAFVREWFNLLEPYSKVATPEMWEGSHKLYNNMSEWEGQVDTDFSSKVWAFVLEAAQTARDAGKDIGPLPDWMKESS